MQKPSCLALAVPVLFSLGVARADVLPPGHKGVRPTIRVEGALPPDKALVLAHTFCGGTVLQLGQVHPIEWNFMSGPMRLVVVDAAAAPKIEKACQERERDVIDKLLARSVPCSEEFQSTSALPEPTTTEEIRWHFSIQLAGKSCTGKLLRKEEIAGAAKPAPAPAPAPAQDPAQAAQPPAAAAKAGSCAVTARSDAKGSLAGMLFIALALLGGRRAARARIRF